MSDIKPVDLPTSAGVEYGRGDVRHFSEEDSVGVVGLQTPTRHLAYRDSLLAEKVNELVSAANNKEQFVPLTVPRTGVAPGTEEIVTNFKIPAGFEARILNASVGSSPVSSSITLKIYYSTGYGSLTGQELVSTSSTFSSGVSFYNSGEFIVALINTGASLLEIAASITLTIRPIGSTASLLVGSVIRGERGYPGRVGDIGSQGDPGTGGAGTPGLVWRSTFNAANSYSPPDAVNWTNGGVTQSYISILPNPGPGAALPSNATYWSVLASAGSSGTAGTGLNWTGAWSNGLTYAVNDAVSDSVSGITSSYVCTAAVGPTATRPGADPSHWDILAGPGGGETPTYAYSDLSASASYVASIGQANSFGIYRAYGVSSGVSPLPALSFQEYSIANTTGSIKGLAFLSGQWFIYLKASDSVTLTLPVSAVNATHWTNIEAACSVITQGTASVGGSLASLVRVTLPSGTAYQVVNIASTDIAVQLRVSGNKLL